MTMLTRRSFVISAASASAVFGLDGPVEFLAPARAQSAGAAPPKAVVSKRAAPPVAEPPKIVPKNLRREVAQKEAANDDDAPESGPREDVSVAREVPRASPFPRAAIYVALVIALGVGAWMLTRNSMSPKPEPAPTAPMPPPPVVEPTPTIPPAVSSVEPTPPPPPVIGAQARNQLAEAEKIYRELTQSEHDYTARASRYRMQVIRRLLGEADQPLSTYDTFEKAQMASLIQLSKLMAAEQDEVVGHDPARSPQYPITRPQADQREDLRRRG